MFIEWRGRLNEIKAIEAVTPTNLGVLSIRIEDQVTRMEESITLSRTVYNLQVLTQDQAVEWLLGFADAKEEAPALWESGTIRSEIDWAREHTYREDETRNLSMAGRVIALQDYALCRALG